MYDLPGAHVLAAYLKRFSKQGYLFPLAGMVTGQLLKSADDHACCPLLTGAWLCDRSSVGLPAKMIAKNLASPLLLLPYLAFIARDQHKTVSFQFNSCHFIYAGQQLHIHTSSSICCDQAETAGIVLNDGRVMGNRKIDIEQDIDEKDWQVLDEFASKTYVLASVYSRQGAGSEEDRLR